LAPTLAGFVICADVEAVAGELLAEPVDLPVVVNEVPLEPHAATMPATARAEAAAIALVIRDWGGCLVIMAGDGKGPALRGL